MIPRVDPNDALAAVVSRSWDKLTCCAFPGEVWVTLALFLFLFIFAVIVCTMVGQDIDIRRAPWLSLRNNSATLAELFCAQVIVSKQLARQHAHKGTKRHETAVS